MLLIIINPISGKGNSKKIFNTIVKPHLLKVNNDTNDYCLYETDYVGHATELIGEYKLETVKQMILIGGDGLIHEVVQGLNIQNRFDIPIYIIPTGSGNGLAKSLHINSIDDSIRCLTNLKQAQAPNTTKVDLFQVSYGKYKRYSFLSQTWAMISDIDIGTEWLRCIGELRFFWGILKFLFKNKSISGELNYKWDTDDRISVNGQFTLFCSSNVPWISSDFKMLPDAVMDDNLIDIIYIVNYTMTFFEKILLLYYCLRGEHIKKCKYINYIRTSEYSLQELEHKNPSYIVCDGEIINSKNIQVKNTNKKLSFVSSFT